MKKILSLVICVLVFVSMAMAIPYPKYRNPKKRSNGIWKDDSYKTKSSKMISQDFVNLLLKIHSA